MTRVPRTLVGLYAASIPSLVYLFYVGILDRVLILPVAIAATSMALCLYFYTSHEFLGDTHWKLVYGILSLPLLGSIGWIAVQVPRDSTALVSSWSVSTPAIPETFLPRWWMLIILAPATLLLVVALFRIENVPGYRTPRSIERLPENPVYFGAVTGFVGFWGVLFVGLGVIHRIVVVAPIFEELLKFGVALLFAASLFGRSLLARYAFAVIVGVVFGTVEHLITYPGEHHLAFLFRVLFHVVTPGLTISVYTVFEESGKGRLMWVSPALSMLFHFAHNTFVVVASLVLYTASESVQMNVQLAFGFFVIAAAVITTLLTITQASFVFDFHEWVSSFSPTHET